MDDNDCRTAFHPASLEGMQTNMLIENSNRVGASKLDNAAKGKSQS